MFGQLNNEDNYYAYLKTQAPKDADCKKVLWCLEATLDHFLYEQEQDEKFRHDCAEILLRAYFIDRSAFDGADARLKHLAQILAYFEELLAHA
jgi:hypothetical protein